MSYTINKTDGSILTTIIDGNIDQTSSDITLIGKNASTYGEFMNENFIHMLENFASTTSPNNPIAGQLWYDTSVNQLKVYDGSGFRAAAGTFVSNTIPSTLGQGDIWIDSFRKQMYFNDGISTILVGPNYTEQQGISGFITTTILDISNIEFTITLLYVSEILIGIFSKDSFIPKSPIGGYSDLDAARPVNIGFNAGVYSGIKFDVPVTKSESLVGYTSVNGVETEVEYYPEDFISTDGDPTITGTVSIRNGRPLVLGSNASNEINVTSSLFKMSSNVGNQNFDISTNNGVVSQTSFFIDAENERVGIFTDTPADTLDINGTARIRGNLTVDGVMTSISSTVISIDDKNIELGSVNNPTNTTANGGGLTLLAGADGNKTITWVKADQDIVESWSLSDNINIKVGKSYYVNNVEVLSQVALGESVVSALGLTSIGKLSNLDVSNLSISNQGIEFSDPGQANGNIILVPKGTGSVSVSNKKITNLADPTLSSDAANLNTVNKAVKSKPLGFWADTTGFSQADIGNIIIENIFPAANLEINTRCRVFCVDNGFSIVREYEVHFVLGVNTWEWIANISV